MVTQSLTSRILLTCNELIDGKGWLYTVFGRKGISQFLGKLSLSEEKKEIALFKITLNSSVPAEKEIKELIKICPLIDEIKADSFFVFIEYEGLNEFRVVELNQKKAKKMKTLIELNYPMETLKKLITNFKMVKNLGKFKVSEIDKVIKEIIIRTIS
jgi:hypothetical protein